MDERITYWLKGEAVRNFGDDLSAYMAKHIFMAPRVEAGVLRVIGSVISNYMIRDDIAHLKSTSDKIVYWGCGKRDGDVLEPEYQRHCVFHGVRGPLTRDLLGLPMDTPLGDPGLLMPLVYTPVAKDRFVGKALCLPHFTQDIDPDVLIQMSGADIALSPKVASEQELLDLIDAIVSADFVLTGALHAAIIACAYGRPFAFWDTGFVDIPFKWNDFAASVGIHAAFVHDLEQGRAYYEGVKSNIRLLKLVPLLECCPFHVRPDVLHAAAKHDEYLDCTRRPSNDWHLYRAQPYRRS